MLVSLTVGKVDAGVTVLLTPDKRLIEFPSILLPPNISSGSIVDIAVSQNTSKETDEEQRFRALQDRIFNSFGAAEPAVPVLRCRNATQTSVVLEWDPIKLATADLISLSLYRNGQKAGNIPRPLQMHSTKISGLAVDTEYTFYLILRTSAGTRTSDKVTVRTHKMTDLSGITITPGVLPATMREKLTQAVERIGAKIVDGVRIDTTHFVTTEGRGVAWEKAVENNIPVVRPEWVEACEHNGRILGVTRFYLDAMRPGPLPEEPPAPPVPPKEEAKEETKQEARQGSRRELGQAPQDEPRDEPMQETPTQEDEKPEGGYEMAGTGDDKVGQTSDDESADEQEAEPEPKSRAPLPDGHKMRLEEKEEHQMALRPKETETAAGANGWIEAERDQEMARQRRELEDEAADRPPTNTDGSSFQEVEL